MSATIEQITVEAREDVAGIFDGGVNVVRLAGPRETMALVDALLTLCTHQRNSKQFRQRINYGNSQESD